MHDLNAKSVNNEVEAYVLNFSTVVDFRLFAKTDSVAAIFGKKVATTSRL